MESEIIAALAAALAVCNAASHRRFKRKGTHREHSHPKYTPTHHTHTAQHDAVRPLHNVTRECNDCFCGGVHGDAQGARARSPLVPPVGAQAIVWAPSHPYHAWVHPGRVQTNTTLTEIGQQQHQEHVPLPPAVRRGLEVCQRGRRAAASAPLLCSHPSMFTQFPRSSTACWPPGRRTPGRTRARWRPRACGCGCWTRARRRRPRSWRASSSTLRWTRCSRPRTPRAAPRWTWPRPPARRRWPAGCTCSARTSCSRGPAAWCTAAPPAWSCWPKTTAAARARARARASAAATAGPASPCSSRLSAMRNREQWQRELDARRGDAGAGEAPLDPAFVLGVLRAHDASADERARRDLAARGLGDHPFVLVLPRAERSLADVLKHEHLAPVAGRGALGRRARHHAPGGRRPAAPARRARRRARRRQAAEPDAHGQSVEPD